MIYCERHYSPEQCNEPAVHLVRLFSEFVDIARPFCQRHTDAVMNSRHEPITLKAQILSTIQQQLEA